ncbi:MAG: hypothetical protein SFU83_22115 [Meiothermus sp.]|nr:hypothetical protein [Meiothermus sp.]
MTYQELIERVQQYEAEGGLEGLQKAHDLLLEQDISSFSEIERDRIWGHIFNLREDIWELMGLPPVTLSDEDLKDFSVVDVSKYDAEDPDDAADPQS